jgi:hypothetical protein
MLITINKTKNVLWNGNGREMRRNG